MIKAKKGMGRGGLPPLSDRMSKAKIKKEIQAANKKTKRRSWDDNI